MSSMPPMVARYSDRERRERGRDVALGAGVGATGLGLSALSANLSRDQVARTRAARRGAPMMTYGGRPLPRSSRAVATLRSIARPRGKEMIAAGILGLTAGALRRRMRDAEAKSVVAKAETKPPKAGLGLSEYKSQFVYGLPVHQASALKPAQRSEALARTMGVWSAPLAPKGERARVTASQGAALGAAGAVGLGAGALAAGAARRPTAALKALRHAGKPKPPSGLAASNPQAYANAGKAKPTTKQRLADVARSANPKAKAAQAKAALRDPQRRADLARGATTAAVTTPVAGVLSAAAANRTVNRSPQSRQRWQAQDKKVLDMVKKNQLSLAEIAKAMSPDDRAGVLAGGAVGAGGAAYGIRRSARDVTMQARNQSRQSRALDRAGATMAERARFDNIISDMDPAARARANRGNAAAASSYMDALRSKEKAKSLARMGRARNRVALGLGLGAAGLGAASAHQAYRGRKVRKSMDLAQIIKAIEPDIDPDGYAQQMLRDERGRFAGKATDDYGSAIIATPYAESESVD